MARARRAIAPLLMVGVLVATPTAPAAPVALPGAATAVAEYRGLLVFSRYERASDLWYLMLRRPGRPQERLPVGPSDRPFDADIGPDSAGRPEVVYQRCSGARIDERCDLFAFSLARPTGERPIANANSDESDVHPTLWRGRLAWVRIYGDGLDAEPVIYTKMLTAPRSRPSRRLPGVPRRRCGSAGDGCVPTRARTISRLELYGRRLAAVVSYTCRTCPGVATTELRLADVETATAAPVARQTTGLSGQTFVGPSFFDGRLAWYLSCARDSSGCAGDRGGAFRYRVRTGEYSQAGGPARVAGFAENGAARVLVRGCAVETTGAGGDRCRIDSSAAPAYRRIARAR